MTTLTMKEKKVTGSARNSWGQAWISKRLNPPADSPAISELELLELGKSDTAVSLQPFPWANFWLPRMDDHSHGRRLVLGAGLPMKPSEYVLRQCVISADPDEPGLDTVIDFIGDDNLVWNTDYPHPDAGPQSGPALVLGTAHCRRQQTKNPLGQRRQTLRFSLAGERTIGQKPLTT